MAETPAGPSGLSAYEIQRDENIARNQHRLRELGLESLLPQQSEKPPRPRPTQKGPVPNPTRRSERPREAPDYKEPSIHHFGDTRRPMTGEEALQAAKDEGLQLVPGETKSGYKAVLRISSNEYRIMCGVRGRHLNLGHYSTAEEAALV